MKYIEIRGGLRAIVDDEDYEWLSAFKWIPTHKDSNRAYAARTSGKGEHRMHRLIMKAQRGQEIDHINRNPLDNQKKNLRFCTRTVNALNRNVLKNSKSGIKGVSWCKRTKKWLVHIKAKGKIWHLGYFDNTEEAKIAYEKAYAQAMSEALLAIS